MHTKKFILLVIILIPLTLFVWGCSSTSQNEDAAVEIPTVTESLPSPSPELLADVLSVTVNGEPGAYLFSVEISSPDLGCEQYADWWEVIDEQGNLLYRRILAHSHVNEQPFTRSGGPVPIQADTLVWVRAHMFPTGYGGAALRGSPQDGFSPASLMPDFAADLADQPPLPGGCGF